MALNYVTLTVDLFDPQGHTIKQGLVSFTPSAQLTDAADHQVIPTDTLTVDLRQTQSAAQTISLLATDNAAILPSGWAWTVSYSGVPGNPPSFSFFLPFAGGSTQHLASLTPVSAIVTSSPSLQIQASTGVAGFALQNGTPNIMSWTAPNDGQMHRAMLFGELVVTSTETGGALQATITDPGGTVRNRSLLGGGLGVSFNGVTGTGWTVAPNSTVTIAQSSALTAGAAVLYAELWGG